ncbi:unnamed protein product [Linum trigynum]|uniref:Uncharacterized protein n=1 Tax=Linum trigynum TaxID=586398 RepID=A0AAV2FSJ5_9ROSI
MPLISISLRRVLDCDANDVMADLSFGLFKTLKCPPKMTRQGQGEGYSSQLMKGVATDEKQKNQLESQLEKRQKLGNVDAFNKEGVSSNGSHNSPDKQSARATAAPKKVINRVVPAHRRTGVRGALIGDAEDDDEES